MLLAVLMVAALVPGGVGPQSPAAAAGAALVTVSELRVEHLEEPLGLDTSEPRFSWVLSSPERGTAQRAYRILTATSAELLEPGRADVWDSSVVESTQSSGVAWEGPDLKPSTRYHWRVQVFLDDGQDAGAWSDTSWFETGLMAEDGWNGSTWIGAAEQDLPPLDLSGSSWIWFPDGEAPNAPPEERYLRRTLEVPETPDLVRAELIMTADDHYTAWLGEQEVGRSSDDPEAWREARRHPLPVAPGPNVVAVSAFSRPFGDGSHSGAGVLGYVLLTFADGSTTRVETDTTWRTSTTADEGWREVDFDDSHWEDAVVHAPYGGGPWGDNVRLVEAFEPAPLLRREFSLDAPVERARLHVAAGGYARVTLNGSPAGDHVLSPGPTDYDERVQYVSDDVTDLLVEGPNAIGAELGRGFFGVTTTNAWNWDQASWHGDPRLRAVLIVDHTDGTTTRIGSDEQWTTTPGPTLSDSIYEGDVYDARLAQPGYDEPGFDDGTWSDAAQLAGPAGALEGRRQQPVRVTETLQATHVTSPEDGVHVFHFPRQVAGWPRIHVEGPAGSEVRLRSSELLDDDGNLELSTGFTGGEFQTDRYTLAGAGEIETWEPSFSYKGFQFVEVSGWPGETPKVGDVEARVVHNDLDRTGTFSSDNDLFDAIHTAAVNTVVNNLHDVPTDTPKYEKNGWTGDAQLGAELFLRNLDVEALLSKWMDDVSDSRWDDGSPALIAPNPSWSWADRSPTWHSAYVMIPWWMYEHSGDPTVLAAHYDGIADYVDLELGRAVDGISTTELGDYLPPDAVGNPPEDMRVAATAYVHLMTRTAADIAEVLGHDGDAASYRAQAQTIAEAFHREFYDADAKHYRGNGDQGFRQTHQVLALAFGLVPQGLEEVVVDSLVADIADRGDHLWTGVLGTKYLLPVLTEHGHGELAYRVATQTDFPSWGRWFEEGATSMWEHWSDYRSRNHYFLGTIDDWFYGDLAGLQSLEPGYRTIRFRPRPVGDLRQAEAQVRTPLGEAAVAWESTAAGDVSVDVTVPVGATAEVHVPVATRWAVTEGGLAADDADEVTFARMEDGAAVFMVGSGSYAFATDAVLGDFAKLRHLAQDVRTTVDALVEEGLLTVSEARLLHTRSDQLERRADEGYTARLSDQRNATLRAIQQTLTTIEHVERWIAQREGRLDPEAVAALSAVLAEAQARASQASARVLGVVVDLSADVAQAAAGDTVRLQAEVSNTGSEHLTNLDLVLDSPRGWAFEVVGDGLPRRLDAGDDATAQLQGVIPAEHAVAEDVAITGELIYRHRGSAASVPLHAVLDVVSPVEITALEADPDQVTGAEESVTVLTTVRNRSQAPVEGHATIEAPAGWKAEDGEQPYTLDPEDEQVLTFELLPDGSSGEVTVTTYYGDQRGDSASLHIPALFQAWEFAKDGDTEGWAPIHQLSGFRVEDGALRASSTGSDPHLGYTGDLSVPAVDGLIIEVVLETSVSDHAEIYWGTANNPGFAADRQVRFAVSSGAVNTYRVTLPAQDSRLTHLRLDPLETTGDIAVHAIRILR